MSFIPFDTVFNGMSAIIPLSEVQHIEKRAASGGIWVIMKSTRWNYEYDNWDNQVFLAANESDSFIEEWIKYRTNMEAYQLNQEWMVKSDWGKRELTGNKI